MAAKSAVLEGSRKKLDSPRAMSLLLRRSPTLLQSKLRTLERGLMMNAPVFPPSPVIEDTDHRARIVVVSGTVTTLLALAGTFALAQTGENVMGWYADYVLPIGALLVGLVAASGFGAAAWLTGLKMTRALIWLVIAELTLSYLVAHYQEYWRFTGDLSLSGFVAWFDETTRGFAWKEHNGKMGAPLGLLGYGLRALELVGFAGGGALVPLALRRKPYCDPCRTYKRTRLFASLPAGVTPRLFGRTDQAAAAAAHQGALGGVQALFEAAYKGDRALFEQELSARAVARRQAKKLTAHVTVSLVRCPRCADGELAAMLVSGQGRSTQTKALTHVALGPDRVRQLFD
jgi:hypothetical protein